MVTGCVCSKLKTSWTSVVFTNKVGKNSRYFLWAFLIKQLFCALVGYEMIITNSYPTRTRGIIVKYQLIYQLWPQIFDNLFPSRLVHLWVFPSSQLYLVEWSLFATVFLLHSCSWDIIVLIQKWLSHLPSWYLASLSFLLESPDQS